MWVSVLGAVSKSSVFFAWKIVVTLSPLLDYYKIQPCALHTYQMAGEGGVGCGCWESVEFEIVRLNQLKISGLSASLNT